jgi:glycosyltransferase involved in cell wall biosynthesis
VLVAGLEWAPTFFAVASGVLADKPVVATVHTDLERYREIEPLPIGWWSAMRRALRRCAAVVAVSEGVANCVLGLGVDAQRVYVIPNPVKPFARHRSLARDGRVRILTVASLKPIKGVDLVLDTARHLVDLDFMWTVVGDGPERHSLHARAQELGLSDRIEFVGFRPDPTPFYAAADIYILPSRMEGAPLALVEAMSAGLPIVATRCGRGVEDLVDSAVGELVANEDTPALATAIRSLLTDPERRARLGDRARERAHAFEPGKVARRYEELLAAVVTEHRTGRRD